VGDFAQLIGGTADAGVALQEEDLSRETTPSPGGAAMSVSEKFAELKARIEKADQEIQAAATENDAELKGVIDKARKSADNRAAELHANSKDASDKTKRQWLDAQNNWNEHIKHIRAQMDARKAELDVAIAAQDAYDDETDALDAIDFASSAVAEAEYAVLNALRSEKRAEALKESVA
jgi:hypothetical protein